MYDEPGPGLATRTRKMSCDTPHWEDRNSSNKKSTADYRIQAFIISGSQWTRQFYPDEIIQLSVVCTEFPTSFKNSSSLYHPSVSKTSITVLSYLNINIRVQISTLYLYFFPIRMMIFQFSKNFDKHRNKKVLPSTNSVLFLLFGLFQTGSPGLEFTM